MSEDLPIGWIDSRLDDCCLVIQGQSPPGSTYNENGSGLPFFQGKAEFGDPYPIVKKWCTSPNKIAEADDVLISVRAPVGPTNLCPSKACIGRGLAAIRPLGGIPSKYVLYSLRNSVDVLLENATGSTFDAVSGDQLRSHRIRLAPLGEQERIVAEIEKQFTRLDAAAAALKRLQANLKRYWASVLKAACEGRLVPTEAELARKEGCSYETGEHLLAGILKERQAKWETAQFARMAAAGTLPNDDAWKRKYREPSKPDISKLTPLPEGWTWTSIAQVGEVQLGRQRAPQHHYGPYMRPYLRVANVLENRIDVSDVLQMNFTPKEFETFSLRFGDILLNEGQSLELVGRAAMYRDEIPGACFQKTLLRFRPVTGVNGKFALFVFLAYLHTKVFQKISRWTTSMAHLTAERFLLMHFPLPPLAEQVRIVIEVERLTSVSASVQRSLATHLSRVARLRQSILNRAFEGELVSQDASDEHLCS